MLNNFFNSYHAPGNFRLIRKHHMTCTLVQDCMDSNDTIAPPACFPVLQKNGKTSVIKRTI